MMLPFMAALQQEKSGIEMWAMVSRWSNHEQGYLLADHCGILNMLGVWGGHWGWVCGRDMQQWYFQTDRGLACATVVFPNGFGGWLVPVQA